MATSGGHNWTWRPYGNYVKQTSSQEPLYGLEPYLAEMFLTTFWSIVVTFCSDRLSNMSARGHNSLWLAEISKIFFSDTTWRMELKIVMNDYCKLLTKCCYFLDRLKIQDGHIATLWEICKTNFFSRTTGWIGTILGRNVPCKVLIKCCYYLFRSVIQHGSQGP